MSLSPEHRAFLSSQAVDVELAEELGVRSILTQDDAADLPAPWPNFNRVPYLAFPWTSTDGRVEWQARPDDPAPDPRRPGKFKKYVYRSKKMGYQPVLWELRPIDDNTVTVLVVEGTKQALAAASNAPEGVAVFGIGGCRMWSSEGIPTPDLAEFQGYDVTICLDADASHNYKVYDAGVELAQALSEVNAASVAFTRLDPLDGDPKAGLDDVLGAMDATERSGYLTRAIEEAKATPADTRPKDDEEAGGEPDSCWVDLSPYLDGTYTPPEPEVGACRSDGRTLLYKGKCHFLVAETGVGKSWFGLVHVAAELMAGNTVAYVHFEEPHARDTVARLRGMGVPVEVIRSGLKWLDVDKAKEYRKALKALDQPPVLVVLDGVVAACGGKSINDDETVNWFRGAFVNPATKLGAAVLALHHPVKDPSRRGEIGGRGSGSWINLVDGVHFQGVPGKKRISRGRKGSLDIYADKDRAGSVVIGAPDGPHGWRAVATLWVEDVDGKVETTLTAPVATEASQGQPTNEISELADQVVFTLEHNGGRYPTVTVLRDQLRARKVKFKTEDLGAALELLEAQGRLERAPYEERKARPGWLVEPGSQGREPADEAG